MTPDRGFDKSFVERLALALYSYSTFVLQPVYRLKLWLRSRQEPTYGWRVGARFGRYESPRGAGYLWIHAVSLGETVVAGLLIEALRQQAPDLCFLLTHGTASGWLAGTALLRPCDRQEWLPWDTPRATARFLAHFAPVAGVMIETEMWPMLVDACARIELPLYLVNARKSEASFKAALRMRWLSLPTYARLRGALAQSAVDATHLQSLGAPILALTGNIKFDARPSDAQVALGNDWHKRRGKKVLMLASSREGEETAFLDAITALGVCGPDVQYLIVPRHVHRVPQLQQEIESRGLTVSRRSNWQSGPVAADVWLGDTFGELALYYGMSDVALLGGSFAPLGGQNLIEAAACGCPIVIGPHTFNFEEAAVWALAAKAAVRAQDMPGALKRASAWLHDTDDLEAARLAGRAFAQEHRGATVLTAEVLLRDLARSGSSLHRPLQAVIDVEAPCRRLGLS